MGYPNKRKSIKCDGCNKRFHSLKDLANHVNDLARKIRCSEVSNVNDKA